jgi:hypothetical protein
MDNLDRLIAQLKGENKRLEAELQQVRIAIAALRGANANGYRATLAARMPSRMSAAARKRIANAQKKRWAAWRRKHKKGA